MGNLIGTSITAMNSTGTRLKQSAEALVASSGRPPWSSTASRGRAACERIWCWPTLRLGPKFNRIGPIGAIHKGISVRCHEFSGHI